MSSFTPPSCSTWLMFRCLRMIINTCLNSSDKFQTSDHSVIPELLFWKHVGMFFHKTCRLYCIWFIPRLGGLNSNPANLWPLTPVFYLSVLGVMPDTSQEEWSSVVNQLPRPSISITAAPAQRSSVKRTSCNEQWNRTQWVKLILSRKGLIFTCVFHECSCSCQGLFDYYCNCASCLYDSFLWWNTEKQNSYRKTSN